MAKIAGRQRKNRVVVCSIGSVDPLVAAGLAADVRAYAMLKTQAVIVVTAVTAQNSKRVRSIYPLTPRAITDQLQSIWNQVRPDAICIGLIPHAAGIRAVRAFLRARASQIPIVLDPVLRATSGHALSLPGAIAELKKMLPMVSIVTPNIPEAEQLWGGRIRSVSGAQTAAAELSRYGCAVLITGGHLPGRRSTDIFASQRELRTFSQQRQARSMRGMGGLLAAALAANLAKGTQLTTAIENARRFVQSALRAAQPLGSGKAQLASPQRAGDSFAKRSKKRIF